MGQLFKIKKKKNFPLCVPDIVGEGGLQSGTFGKFPSVFKKKIPCLKMDRVHTNVSAQPSCSHEGMCLRKVPEGRGGLLLLALVTSVIGRVVGEGLACRGVLQIHLGVVCLSFFNRYSTVVTKRD